ncbi:MAG: hypothetical protein IK102_06825 [Treponema sp.]|nr:hypothetical protein [Treponema sp.]
MKKNSLQKFAVGILLAGGWLLTAITFTSCQNFLKGSETKQELQRAIDYANAQKYTIKVNYQNKTGVVKSPAGAEVDKKVTDTFSICFDPFADYEFLYWKIIDASTDKELPNGEYLSIKSISESETLCTFVKAPEEGMKLSLYPVTVERPQILSNSPVYLAEGVFKDSTIQIVFDYDMDEYSIYYTDEELKELRETVGESNILDPVTITKNTQTYQRYYGYKQLVTISDEDGNEQEVEEYCYKNIIIKDNETYQNRNSWFNAPVFNDPKTLSIKTKDGNIIPDYYQFLVMIEKDFFYKQDNRTKEGKKVTMAYNKKWIYQVKDQTDNVAPSIANDNDLKISLTTGDPVSKTTNIPTVTASTKFMVTKKLNLDVKLTDTGSGPDNTFDVYIDKVQNASYENITSKKVYEQTLKYQRVTSQNAIFHKDIDVSSISESGIYKVYFKFNDRSTGELNYPLSGGYYFVIDGENTMGAAQTSDTSTKDTDYRMKVYWVETKDLNTTSVRYKKDSGSTWSSPVVINRGTSYKEFTGLKANTKYNFETTYTDFAGNIVTKTTTSTTGGLKSISVIGTPSKTFYFANDNFDKTGLTVKAKLTNDSEWTLNSNAWSTNLAQSKGCNTTVNVEYTSDGVKKTASIGTPYNVACADAMTNSPVSLGSKRYKFGDFPQTLKKSNITVTSQPIYKGYNSSENNWYLGSDGYFYVYCQEKAYNSSIYYISPGTDQTHRVRIKQAADNSFQYFKVEPIVWKKITDNYKGHFLLVAEKSLFSGIPFSSFSSKKTIGGKTIYPDNYKYSTLRAYLNGSYESDDTIHGTKTYDGKGFLQTAFSDTARNQIKQVELDNNSNYTSGYYSWSGNSCDNTTDKVFLLSFHEYSNTSYGFTEWLYNLAEATDSQRKREGSDYALANGQYRNVDDTYTTYDLRTASSSTNNDSNIYYVWATAGNGFLTRTESTSYAKNGIVPAICLDQL